MNKKLFGAFLFTAGAAIGAVVTWKIVKTKYEEIAQEEIDSVKEEYNTLKNLMQKEVAACRKLIDANKTDEDETQEADDEYYPDDDERDFTEHEKEMVDYYKLSSRYRSSANENSENDDNCKEGDNGDEDYLDGPNGPYVITPEEFNSSPPGFNVQPLDYFADGVLADGWGVKLDIDETIGEDSIEHFGEYADGILYVRNERNEIDYEVTLDPRTYDEAVRLSPNPYYGHEN